MLNPILIGVAARAGDATPNATPATAATIAAAHDIDRIPDLLEQRHTFTSLEP